MNNQSNEIKSNNSFKALEMQDEKIKELISRYNEFKNPRTKRKLISILSPVIVNYPHFYKYLDEDFCHDFYIFILSKLDKILSKYTPFSSSKFSSWFSVTINRNLWLFIHCEKRKNKYRIEEIQADENVEKKYFVSENTVKYESDDNECYDFFNTILHSSILSGKEKKIMILKFLNMSIFPYEDPTLQKKIERIETIRHRINKNRLHIFNLQKKLCNCKSEKKRKEISDELTRIKKYYDHKKECLKNLSICRSNKWVAQQLGLKTSTISSMVMRAKKKLQNTTPIVLFPTVDNEDKKI